MKRGIVIVLFIIILIALGVMVKITFFPDEQKSGDEGIFVPPVEIKTPAELAEVRTATTKTETLRRYVNAERPAFSNLSDFSFQENVNKIIADSINPYINEIAIVADESVPATAMYRYTVNYERYNNEDYVSLVVLQNYSTGGMRSNVWRDTYTIDVVNCKVLSLADVCSSADYKKIIVTEINQQAKNKGIDLFSGNGITNIPDTQRFYIKDSKLYIYFEPASVAPYLDGEMHFEMPFEFINGKFIMN